MCPAGQKVLGGGIFSSGAFTSSFINGIKPEDGPDAGDKPDDAWVGFVDAYNGVTLTADAVCHGGNAASKLKYREVQGPVGPSLSRGTLTARCPNGFRVTGGGVFNSAIFNEIDVKISRPVEDGTAWEGQVRAFHGGGGQMSVHAVCATGGFADDLVYRSKSAIAQAGTQKGRTATCPGGAKVVGGGAAVRKGSTQLNSTGVASSSGWASFVDGLSVDAKFTTYAVCHT